MSELNQRLFFSQVSELSQRLFFPQVSELSPQLFFVGGRAEPAFTANTRVAVAGRHVFDLPRGGRGREAERDSQPYDAEIGRIRQAIRAARATLRDATAHGEVMGVVHAVPPDGRAVPIEDVLQMMGLLREAGVPDIWCPVGDLPR